ncbi:MAG: hypothetical protein H6737_13640 [Alphaproteobacteria bacterium]|nr:hypothetical protein [Alphaproteobacteria bacterium]
MVYDVKAQRFAVERRVEGVTAGFFGCSDTDSCAEAIQRAATLASGPADRSMADRLAQRLVDSGAEQVDIRLERDGDGLNVLVTYAAPVGSKAAVDTYVHPEWTGTGDRGAYSLVVDAQDSMGAPPDDVELRREPVDANGTWKTSWVYSKKVRDVVWGMSVDPEPDPIFAKMPELAKRLKKAGLLDAKPKGDEVARVEPMPVDAVPPAETRRPKPEPAAKPQPAPKPEPVAKAEPAPKPEPIAKAAKPEPVPKAEPAPKPEPVPKAEPAPKPEPVPKEKPTKARPEPEPVAKARPEPDPSDEAPPPAMDGQLFTYDPRIEGAMSPDVAAAAAKALEPGVRECHRQRMASGAVPEGYLFADALVRSDGWLLSYSVYGEVDDPDLLACVNALMDTWEMAPWAGPEGAVSTVSVPYQFRRGSAGVPVRKPR